MTAGWDRIARRSVRAPSGCLIWIGARDGRGYGKLRVHGRTWQAHRYAYAVVHGDPGDLLVCHRCDVRLCVEPTHLWLGTPQDNTDDMLAKGRHRVAPPEQHRSVKLSRAIVRDLRDRHARGEGYRALGREFGVDHKTVRKAVLGQTWKAVE